MGELERIRPSLGSSFGHDLGQRVNAASDRPAKKHHESESGQMSDDAIELHDESGLETIVQPNYSIIDCSEGLDLSA